MQRFMACYFFVKKLEKHLQNYTGLELFHMSHQFQKSSNVVPDRKTTN